MDGWHWAAAITEAILLTILVLVWYANLRERPGWSLRRATRRAALATPVIPLGFVVVLFVPLWLGAILLVIPLLAVVTLALID